MAVASLAQYIQTKLDKSYYTRALAKLSSIMEANSIELEKQQKYHDKWEKAFDKAKDSDTSINDCGFKKDKGTEWSDAQATAYADAKVEAYDEAYFDELAELDLDYDATKTMYEALITKLQAEEESWKTQTASEYQDNHLLQS